MWSWLFGKNLKDELYKTKKVRVKNIRFEIKKVNILNYLDGSKVLLQSYDIHKTANAKAMPTEASQKEILKHYKQVLVAGVVTPALSFESKDGFVNVEDLMYDMDLVTELYTKIMILTYGKKKVKQHTSAVKNALS